MNDVKISPLLLIFIISYILFGIIKNLGDAALFFAVGITATIYILKNTELLDYFRRKKNGSNS